MSDGGPSLAELVRRVEALEKQYAEQIARLAAFIEKHTRKGAK